MEFVFLSRFWGKERKEVEFSILRSAIASTSHLKRFIRKFKERVEKKLIKLRRDDFKINRQVRNRLHRPWPHLSCI